MGVKKGGKRREHLLRKGERKSPGREGKKGRNLL